MIKQILGVTRIVKAGQDATGIYNDDNGTQVFETDEPYLLSDGVSLQPPLSVFDAGGPIFYDSTGNAQPSLGVKGLDSTPPVGIMWDGNTPWDNGTYWS